MLIFSERRYSYFARRALILHNKPSPAGPNNSKVDGSGAGAVLTTWCAAPLESSVQGATEQGQKSTKLEGKPVCVLAFWSPKGPVTITAFGGGVGLHADPPLLKVIELNTSNGCPVLTGAKWASKNTSKKEVNVPPPSDPMIDIIPLSLPRFAGSSVTNTSKKLPWTFTGAVLSIDSATS